MSDNHHSYQLLLAKAAQLYEKHGVGHLEPLHTNFREKYMDALKKLCLEDNNLVLVMTCRMLGMRQCQTYARNSGTKFTLSWNCWNRKFPNLDSFVNLSQQTSALL